MQSYSSILVTGGAGYVGSTLIRVLLKSGHKVTCLDNLRVGGESLIGVFGNPNFTYHKCDITNHNHVSHIINNGDYFAVVHLSAIVGDPACRREPDLARMTNWDASVHLLNESIKHKIHRFIFASTCSNYGKMSDSEKYVDENSVISPISQYAELKVKFEKLLLDNSEKHNRFCPTSLRFATVYGLSHRMRFDLTVNEFTKELSLGRELKVFGEQFWRPYCHVGDFSKAIMAVLDAPRHKVAYECFNVGDTQENYSKKMIIDELLKLFPDAMIRRVEKKDDPRNYRVSFEKIKRELGFTISKTVSEGIKEVKEAIELGIIQHPDDQRYYNIPHTI